MDVSVASTNERLLPSNDHEKKSAIAKSDLSQEEWNQTFDEVRWSTLQIIILLCLGKKIGPT